MTPLALIWLYKAVFVKKLLTKISMCWGTLGHNSLFLRPVFYGSTKPRHGITGHKDSAPPRVFCQVLGNRQGYTEPFLTTPTYYWGRETLFLSNSTSTKNKNVLQRNFMAFFMSLCPHTSKKMSNIAQLSPLSPRFQHYTMGHIIKSRKKAMPRLSIIWLGISTE